jgi:VWFA-related protein
MTRSATLLALLLLCPALASPQSAPADTIRITSRIVYVDVVVHDYAGHTVHGLPRKDFHIFEDGKPQTIDYFSEYNFHPSPASVQTSASAQTSAPTPSPRFTNVISRGTSLGPINIILFDMANTPAEDQLYARLQLIKFLRNFPAGQRVALFTLTDHLSMIQPLTSDSAQLLKAAQQFRPQNTGFVESRTERMMHNNMNWSSYSSFGPDMSGSAVRFAGQQDLERANQINIGAEITVGALADLGKVTSGYQGRKNLFWLSDNFPIAVGSQLNSTMFQAIANLPGAKDTSNLLANAQIAIYPISLQGLQTDYAYDPASRSPQSLASGFFERAALHSSMEDIAYLTGGEAYFGTNDFAGALRRGMSDGSNYYTLAYSPRNEKWNGQFRKIKVRLTVPGYSLAYRRGYFAFTNAVNEETPAREIASAMQPEIPQSTMLALSASVQLTNSHQAVVRVDCAVNPADIELANTADGHHRGSLLVSLLALSEPDGKISLPPKNSGTLRLDFTPHEYDQILKTGISFREQLMLKPGQYRLRLGVTDMSSHRVGTLDMPITVPAPLSAPPQ